MKAGIYLNLYPNGSKIVARRGIHESVVIEVGDLVISMQSGTAADNVALADALHSAAKMFEDLVVKDTLKEVKP